jgi:TM2 domain-containing membrane protein YozV
MNNDNNDGSKSGFDRAGESAREFQRNFNETVHNQDNKKILAGILGIVLGGLGVHKFILGYNQEGIIPGAVTILGFITSCIFIGAFFVWIPGLIGFIEGIIYLTKSDEEFYHTYQLNKKPWF